MDKIADLIDKSLELGATTVNSLNFFLSNKDELCTNMLSNASKQLKKRADAVALSAGSGITGIKTLKPSCSINQARNYSYSRNMMMAKAVMVEDAAGATAEAAPTTNIEAGNIKLYASIDAIFFLR